MMSPTKANSIGVERPVGVSVNIVSATVEDANMGDGEGSGVSVSKVVEAGRNGVSAADGDASTVVRVSESA